MRSPLVPRRAKNLYHPDDRSPLICVMASTKYNLNQVIATLKSTAGLKFIFMEAKMLQNKYNIFTGNKSFTLPKRVRSSWSRNRPFLVRGIVIFVYCTSLENLHLSSRRNVALTMLNTLLTRLNAISFSRYVSAVMGEWCTK